MLKRLEFILIISAIIAINFQLLLWPIANPLTILSFGALALFYPILSLALFLDEENKMDIRSWLPGFIFAVPIIGILFKLQMWPGYEINLFVGMLSLLGLIIYSYTQKDKSKAVNFKIFRKRAIPLFIITVFMFLIPKYAWLETKYSNYPDYIEIYKAADQNPNDELLQQKLDSTRQSIY